MSRVSSFLAGFILAHAINVASQVASQGADQATTKPPEQAVFRPTDSGGLVTQTDERAPNSKESGVFWMHKDGTTIRLYVKDWITGDWRGPVDF